MDEEVIEQKEARIADLKQKILALDNQLLALTDEYDKKFRDRRAAYKAKYDERFKDLNVKAALVGSTARWPLTLMGATYFFELPSGAVSADVEAFLLNPITTVKELTTNWAPVSNAEALLLRMLSGVQLPGQQEASFKSKKSQERLYAIRQWPEALSRGLAEKAATMETYLNICMELELGN